MIIQRILAKYNLSYSKILPPQKGYRNASYAVLREKDEPLNVILYKNEPDILARIKNANSVGNYVANNNLPARSTYSTRIIRLRSASQTRYAAVYAYLPGKTIPWEAYTMEHIKTLGHIMAVMHEALRAYDRQKLPDVSEENLQLNRRMIAYFSRADVAQALKTKLELVVIQADFIKLLQACKKLPHQQALHMDFVRGNILFEDTQITGILDFEKTARGHVFFDIARTLAFLFVDCKYKQEQKVRKYFLQSGYIKRGSVALKNMHVGNTDVLEELISFFLLHDFYKFLRHNPYESLLKNEHFTRTKTMLLKRGLIAHA